VLVPKCPLCVAAYLSIFGVSAGVASLAAPWLRSACLLLAAAALLPLLRWGRVYPRPDNDAPPPEPPPVGGRRTSVAADEPNEGAEDVVEATRSAGSTPGR
jgi:hypothetical protein